MPKISEVAHIAMQSADVVDDIPAHAYVVWGEILENGCVDTDGQVLDGIPGILWRGSVTDVIVGLWPDLRQHDDTRKAINSYLRQTENMICIKRGSSPLWWLRREWNDVNITLPRGFKPVRSAVRASQENRTAAPVAPVVSSWRCPEPECGCVATSRDALDEHSQAHTAQRMAKLVDQNKYLQEENSRLRSEHEALRSMFSEIRKITRRD